MAGLRIVIKKHQDCFFLKKRKKQSATRAGGAKPDSMNAEACTGMRVPTMLIIIIIFVSASSFRQEAGTTGGPGVLIEMFVPLWSNFM